MLTELEPGTVHAPELYGSAWLNGDPVMLRNLEGGILLVDFWDSVSAASLRALPILKEWYDRYRDMGLTVVGVHTPEFAFGADDGRVASAVRALGIRYPVMLDNAALVWGAYRIQAWPTRVLVDRTGNVRFMQSGNEGYHEFERGIQVLLRDAGYRGSLQPLIPPFRREEDIIGYRRRTTGDLRLGYVRGSIGNVEGLVPETRSSYADPGLYLPGRVYADGIWWAGRESLRSSGVLGERSSLSLEYDGSDIFVVAGASAPAQMFVELDGGPLSPGVFGADVRRGPDGTAAVLISEPRLYHLAQERQTEHRRMRLSVTQPGIDVYAMSILGPMDLSAFSEN
ncbi:MAG: redoxin domain-containing protein [Bacteroidetes bacterium]|jgi:thiol-disulfide isomerase/thioredoxin|nr:redoxin domain-containing protein [Bacteroidota bacterium]